MLDVLNGALSTSTNSTRNNNRTLFKSKAHVILPRPPAAAQLAQVRVEPVTVTAAAAAAAATEPSYYFELAGMCDAIDQQEETAYARAAAEREAVKKLEAASRAASPSSSGTSEASSSQASCSSTAIAPFGQAWVPIDECPLRRITKRAPAVLRPLTLMDVWIVDVPAQHTVTIFDFVKRHDLQGSNAGHLKRVKKVVDMGTVSILLKTSVVDEQEGEHLAQLLASDPALASLPPLVPYVKAVPAAHAESNEQLLEWGEYWPISYIPMHAGARAKTLPKRWTEHQLAWIHQGMQRVVDIANRAKAQGELPVACMVSDSYDLAVDPILQPSPNELASSHDTRASTGNTLCHAFRNLIAAVAEIDRKGARQMPRTPPSSRGATLPYLLTGMTLFTSHEPCLLCSMALLHSRVQVIIYAIPADGAGGCGSVYDVHEDEGLNHKFEAWQISGIEGLESLEIDP